MAYLYKVSNSAEKSSNMINEKHVCKSVFSFIIMLSYNQYPEIIT